MIKLPEPKKYFGIDAEPDFSYFTSSQMREYAADVSAALREHRDSAERFNLLLSMDNVALRGALKTAEAALADIGDSDREPGDDLAWCEARAAQALPAVRKALGQK